jgi:hypothetical protein
MSAIVHDAGLRKVAPGSALRAILKALGRAFDTYSAYRANNAVGAADLQHMDEEIIRYRRLMRAGR